jgi:LysM repeat protein
MADTQAGVLKFLIFVVGLIKKYAMRLRATVLLLISFFFVQFAQSQSNELIVQGQTGALYLEHSVVARETWYSVGRLYNLPPKELTAYNHLTLTPLAIGQTLRIPLTATNFSQDGQKTPAETLVPVMHVVQEKEWMYRISVNHNKVPIPTLEKWNHITGAQLHPGLHLIVGYLKVKTALSALAAGGGIPAVAGAGTSTGATAGAGGTTGAGAAKAGRSDGGTTTPAANSTGTPAQADGGMAAPVTKKPVDSSPVATVTTAVSKPPAAKVVDNSASSTAAATTAQFAPHFNGGVFKSDFSDGGKSATGQSGIFKSTSGWQDGKYYALMNNAAVGTIIRVSDASTGKSVYAKVLGQLPDMKESAGLTVRLSNAAAAELGEGDALKFNVTVAF